MTYGTRTPPGWYPDPMIPAGSHLNYRWWDGAQWTPYVHVSAPPPALTGKEDPLYWVIPVGRPWQAIVAGYLGIACTIMWLLGPVGVVFGAASVAFGIAGLKVAERQRSGGQARSWFGVIAGALSIVASIWLITAS